MRNHPRTRRQPDNRLLAALPGSERRRLRPHLEPVHIETKQVLIEIDTPITHVYFPLTSVVSMVSTVADGTAVEVATIGHEGFVGLPLFLGVDRTLLQAFAQIAGQALRMEAATFRRQLGRTSALHHLLERYTQALFVQLAQDSACNRLHTVEERCARWILFTADRVGSPTFPLTHEYLAMMMGLRRATVSGTAAALQREGLIRYRRGVLTVVDRAGLEAASCECYGIITAEFARLLDGAEPHSALHGAGRRFVHRGRSTLRPPPQTGEGVRPPARRRPPRSRRP